MLVHMLVWMLFRMLVQTSSGIGSMDKYKGDGKGEKGKAEAKGKGEMVTSQGKGDIGSVRT